MHFWQTCKLQLEEGIRGGKLSLKTLSTSLLLVLPDLILCCTISHSTPFLPARFCRRVLVLHSLAGAASPASSSCQECTPSSAVDSHPIGPETMGRCQLGGTSGAHSPAPVQGRANAEAQSCCSGPSLRWMEAKDGEPSPAHPAPVLHHFPRG